MSWLDSFFGDKKTQTQNSTQTGSTQYGLTPDIANYWSQIQSLYNPQTWSPVAPNQYQEQAAANQTGYASSLNPAFGAASGIAQGGISTADINRFMTPYTQNVVDATRADFAVQNARENAANQGQAAKLGALGGTNASVARNLASESQRRQQDPIIAGLYNQGYSQAADLAAKSTSAQLGGIGGAASTAATQGGLNNTLFGQGTQFWNQAYQNQLLPYQLANMGVGALTGLSPYSGVNTSGTSTGTATTLGSPSPFSILSNLAGLGISAYGGGLFRKDGGRVGMAEGGSVGGDDADPHQNFVKAFDTISGLLTRAKGGAVMKPYAGGGEVGPWETSIQRSPTGEDWTKFGRQVSALGAPSSGSAASDDGYLRDAQSSLSSFMSGMRPRFDGGGAVSGYPSTDTELFDAIKGLEGFRPRAYGDYKQHSIGYGTRANAPDEVITRDEADRRLRDEVLRARGYVDEFAPNLDPGTRAALTSLTYNAGPGWQKSGLGAAVRAGDWDDARSRFLQYTKAGGEDLPGLIDRRKREAAWGFGSAPNPSLGDPEGARLAATMGAPPGMDNPASPSFAAGPAMASSGRDEGWLSRFLPGLKEGIFAGKPLTGAQTLGNALMSIRGPMFEGPLNGFARSIMESNQARMNERQIDNQVAQLLGEINGKPTLMSRQTALEESLKPARTRLIEAQTKQAELAADKAYQLEVARATAEMQKEVARADLEQRWDLFNRLTGTGGNGAGGPGKAQTAAPWASPNSRFRATVAPSASSPAAQSPQPAPAAVAPPADVPAAQPQALPSPQPASAPDVAPADTPAARAAIRRTEASDRLRARQQERKAEQKATQDMFEREISSLDPVSFARKYSDLRGDLTGAQIRRLDEILDRAARAPAGRP